MYTVGLYLGGEELKNSAFALLLFGAGLLINITYVSAQEALSEDHEISISAEDRPVSEEQALYFVDAETSAAPVAGPSVWAFVRMLLILALAAAAIYGIVFFVKRSAKPAAASDPFLKVLASSHLGSNRYAHIVSVGSKAWLLGSSDGAVNLISEIEDQDVLNSMLLEDSRKSGEAMVKRFPDFLSMLRRLGSPAETRTPLSDDIRKRRERLKGL